MPRRPRARLVPCWLGELSEVWQATGRHLPGDPALADERLAPRLEDAAVLVVSRRF